MTIHNGILATHSLENRSCDYNIEKFCSDVLSLANGLLEAQKTIMCLEVIKQDKPRKILEEACSLIVKRSRCGGHTSAVYKLMNYLDGNTVVFAETRDFINVNIPQHVSLWDFRDIDGFLRETLEVYSNRLKQVSSFKTLPKIQNVIFDGVFSVREKYRRKMYDKSLQVAEKIYLRQEKTMPFLVIFIG